MQSLPFSLTATSPEPETVASRREAGLLGLAFLFLALASLSFILAPIGRAGTSAEVGERLAILVVLPVWAASAWLIRRMLAQYWPGRDPYLLPSAYLLAGWGMLTIWRLSPVFGARQTAWFLVATAAMAQLLRWSQGLEWLRRYRYLWLVSGLALTALTLLFGTNPSGGEPRLWLGCCGLYFQPSEPLRLLLVAFLASYLADRLPFLRAEGRRFNASTLAPLLVMWGISIALLFVQRDLGTGTLFLALLAVLLYLGTGYIWPLLISIAMAVVGGLLAAASFSVVHLRLEAWLNPWADPIGSGYQIVQALISLASGGVLGRGFGMGAPGVVPVAHSDFIFTAIVEEWGLLGGVVVLALLAVVVGRGLRAARVHRSAFHALLAAGLSVALALQALLILGGVTRLLPLTGVTLPFVSYGGSSLLTSGVILALLLMLSAGRDETRGFDGPILPVQAGINLAWLAVAMALMWWIFYRGPTLQARTDNPRRALAERISPRGALLDRDGRVLARTEGTSGSYRRSYPAPEAAPVVGYDSLRYGQAGLEASMDAWLRGEQGYDAWTVTRAELLSGAPPPGLDVQLTLDLEAQRAAQGALADMRGAAVVLDALTGDILAVASSPSFDPNSIGEAWATLTQDPGSPLLNRALQGRYQPGISLGPLVVAWAQAAGLLELEAPVAGPPEPLQVDGTLLECARSPLAGLPFRWSEALRFACPRPVAAVGQMLGGPQVEAMFRDYALDRRPVLGAEGAFDYSAQDVQVEDGYLAAAGQGALTVSPLQMARAYAVLASGGRLPGLRLVSAVQDPQGSWIPRGASGDPGQVLPPRVAEGVLDALRGGADRLSWVAEAAGGSESETLLWGVGVLRDRPAPWVVVMVLEDESLERARAALSGLLDGLQLLP